MLPLPVSVAMHNRNNAATISEGAGHGSHVDERSAALGPITSVGGASATEVDVVSAVITTSLLPSGSVTGMEPVAYVLPIGGARERVCFQQFLITAVVAALTLILVVTYVWRSTSARNIDATTGKVRPYSFQYFVLCFLGGIAAGSVHLVVAPIDIVKCRVQVGEYRNFKDGFAHLFSVEAGGSVYRALPLFFRGWLPTLWGYCIQGSLKFSLYEVLKYVLLAALVEPSVKVNASAAGVGGVANSLVSSSKGHVSGVYQFFAFLFSSCLAEVVADLGLAPWEAVKIRMQTSSSFPVQLRSALPRLWETEGLQGFYRGLVPLWGRQVPYTMMKFSSFEFFAVGLQSLVHRLGVMGAAEAGVVGKLVVSLLAGVLAGLLCGVVSHPADTVLSRMSQRTSTLTSSAVPPLANMLSSTSCSNVGYGRGGTAHSGAMHGVLEVVRELRWSGVWKGLAPRLLMVALLTALQWVTYDGFKVWAGLPTSGDAET